MADPSPSQGQEPTSTQRPIPGWAKISGVFLLLAGGVVFLLTGTGASDALAYSKLVPDVVDHPGEFAGRVLRVEGQLKDGSVKFRQDPCEWRFVLTKNGREMPVRFSKCVVPDTFRDGLNLTVTVQGKLGPHGTFVASQVIPRCPSKYEMQRRQKNGEKMPHPAAMPTTPGA